MRTPVVYFILSHTNVEQVVRLVRRIRSDVPDSTVLLHHDAHEEAFDRDAFADDPRVLLLEKSIHGEWGRFSLVEIVLYGLEELVARDVRYDRLVLLSGQDYPIVHLLTFERELARKHDGFIESDPRAGGLLDRYRFSWIALPRALQRAAVHRLFGVLGRLNGRQPFVRFVSGRVGCRVGLASPRSPFPRGTQLRKGTQWWALSARSLAYVRAFVAQHPAFVRHFRERTIVPDEAFFHTILSSSPSLTFVNDDKRFTRWASARAASPDVLRSDDFDAIVASGDFFARKFDSRLDARVLDRLDAHAR